MCSSCYPALRARLIQRGRWEGRAAGAEACLVGGRALAPGSVWRLDPDGRGLAGLVGYLLRITASSLTFRVQVRGVSGVLTVSRELVHEVLLPV